MVQINFGQREVSCKVVFYGPGMSGKTTNLEVIHKKAPKEAVGEMVSIATETDRTLYFDFLPLDLGQVAGMRTKFQLYTVPGQIYYNATRKLVLQGVDGVIFVADSSPEKMPENLESLQNLRDNLAEMGLKLEDLPIVLQYNKRDLPTAMAMAEMNVELNPMGAPVFEGVAREGKGVFATLKEISRLVIEKLNKEHAPAANRRRTASNLESAAKSPSGGSPVHATSGGHALHSTSGGHKIPVPPPPPRPSTPLPPASSTTPLGQNRLPQRPPPPPPRQTMERSPSAGMPHGRQTAPGPALPQRTLPAAATPPPPIEEPSPKERHLAKAKPPAIDKRAGGPQPDLGATDPNLRRYQEQRSGGGGTRTVLIVLLVMAILLMLAVLFVVIPALTALLPESLQRAVHPQNTTAAPNAIVPGPTTPAVHIAQPSAPLSVAPAVAPTAAAPPPARTVTPPPAPPVAATSAPPAAAPAAPPATAKDVPVAAPDAAPATPPAPAPAATPGDTQAAPATAPAGTP